MIVPQEMKECPKCGEYLEPQAQITTIDDFWCDNCEKYYDREELYLIAQSEEKVK